LLAHLPSPVSVSVSLRSTHVLQSRMQRNVPLQWTHVRSSSSMKSSSSGAIGFLLRLVGGSTILASEGGGELVALGEQLADRVGVACGDEGGVGADVGKRL